MPQGIIPQQSTQTLTEGAVPLSGIGGVAVLADLAVLFSQALGALVSRQIMTIGDPTTSAGVASVTNTVPDGHEFALLTRLSPGSPEMQIIISELRMLRAELQQINLAQGVPSATAPPLIDSNQSG